MFANPQRKCIYNEECHASIENFLRAIVKRYVCIINKQKEEGYYMNPMSVLMFCTQHLPFCFHALSQLCFNTALYTRGLWPRIGGIVARKHRSLVKFPVFDLCQRKYLVFNAFRELPA